MALWHPPGERTGIPTKPKARQSTFVEHRMGKIQSSGRSDIFPDMSPRWGLNFVCVVVLQRCRAAGAGKSVNEASHTCDLAFRAELLLVFLLRRQGGVCGTYFRVLWGADAVMEFLASPI